MNEDYKPIQHPKGFRPRRGQNWCFIGLLYTSFYLCRYNLSIANKSISDTYKFTHEDMGWIITTAMLAYGFGLIINGLIADRIGGKRAMLIGACGTIVLNLAFGAASFVGLLGLFTAIRGVDGYFQSFGAPGMVKINTAWFAHRERGRFSGIFGFMINLGRFGIFRLGPALLSGFVLLGMLKVPPLHWRWLFWAPSIVCAMAALAMAIFVKNTPEEAGWSGVIPDDTGPGAVAAGAGFSQVLWAIAGNRVIWITALAYACTGVVRQSVDNWFPRYMQDVYQTKLDSPKFQYLAFLIPAVASAGSMLSGWLSDTVFKGRRAPVAALLYFTETAVIMAATQAATDNAAVLFFILISFTANSTHSILGSAAPMDLGGRRYAGFALGLIDSFQYFGGSLSGYFLGKLLDKNMHNYFWFMVPFGFIGGILMLLILGRITEAKKTAP